MKVWVKEIPGVFEIHSMRNWIKQDVHLNRFLPNANVEVTDVLLVSRHDQDKKLPLCTVVVFEDVIEKLMQSVLQEYHSNYDRYYMENALEEAREGEVENIITGSSYGLFGINSLMIQNSINMSLASQDLYYSIKGIYEIWKVNKNIKNIVLCMSYYGLFSDLSKVQNSNELARISKVYWPLFKDAHNCVLLPTEGNALPQSNIFDVEGILRIYATMQYQKSYWNENKKRSEAATKLWKDKTKGWLDLSEDEKVFGGGERAELHNKNIKYEAAFLENIDLLQRFLSFCNENQINLWIVVTPVSKYYRAFSEHKFQEIFYDVLNRLEGKIHLLDLYEEEIFVDQDFNDMDHLSDQGADKMTSIILDFLNDKI